MNRSLKIRLTAVFLLVGLISASIVGFVGLWIHKKGLENDLRQRSAQTLRDAETVLSEQLRYVENIAMLLKGAIEARNKVGLKLNVPKDKLDAIVKLLPAEKSPTVSGLSDGDWVAVEVIVEEKVERELVPQLKRAGATGLITYPLNKIIH